MTSKINITPKNIKVMAYGMLSLLLLVKLIMLGYAFGQYLRVH